MLRIFSFCMLLVVLLRSGFGFCQSANGEGFPAEALEVGSSTAAIDKTDSESASAAKKVFLKAVNGVRAAFKSAGDRLKSTDIKLNLPVDLIESENFTFGARYTFESEPLYQGNIHLRADHWTFSAAIPAGDSVRGIDGNSFGAELRKQARMTFIRPFPERKYALNEFYAYSPGRFPWTADLALNRLEPGDVAVLTSEMSLLVSATAAPALSKALEAMGKALPFITTHYVLKGEFQIHVTRLPGTWVQLKVIPVFGNEWGVKSGVKPAAPLEIFAVSLLNKRVERWSRIERGVLFAEFVKRDGFLGLVNYKLNLHSDFKEIRKGYEQILSRALSLEWLKPLKLEPDDLGGFVGLFAATVSPEVLRLFDPISNRTQKLASLVADASELEELLRKSLVLAPDRRGIDREFFGRTEFKQPGSTNFGVNLLLWRGGRSFDYRDLFIAAEPEDGKGTEYFRVGVFDRTTESNLFFSLYKETALSSALAVFQSDSRENVQALKDLVFEWQYRDKDLSKRDFRMVQESLMQSLPKSVFSQINWGGFVSGRSYNDAELRLRLIFDSKALDKLSQLNYWTADHWSLFEKYLLSIPAPLAESEQTLNGNGALERPSLTKAGRLGSIDYYRSDVETIATKLTAVLKGVRSTANGEVALTPFERYEAFSDLRLNPLFIEVGAGYILSLIPEEDLSRLVGFELSLTADGAKPAELPANLARPTQQFKNISTIRSVLRTGVGGSLADLYHDVGRETIDARLK